MKFIFHKNANLGKILIALLLLFNIKMNLYGQDPITDAVNREKHDIQGINFYPAEIRELERIHKKYEITDHEKELRLKKQSGQKLRFFDNYRLGKANRKDYLRAKKLQKFNRKVILSRQNKETQQRMIENEKRIKARDKQIKKKQKRKMFLNLFR